MPWTTVLIIVPLLGALSMFAVPEGGALQARIHAVVASLITLVLSFELLRRFDRDAGGLQLVDSHDWASSVGLRWTTGVDGISIWLVLLTTVLFFIAIAYSAFAWCDRPRAYLGLLLLAEAALIGLFVAGDLVLFYVFWEAMLIPFIFLVGLWGDENRRSATIQFVIYTMVGSLIMLVAVVATGILAQRHTGGAYTFTIADLAGVDFTERESTWLFAGFALAFAIKLPLFPFHAWLPKVYSAAPILVTALLAAVMSKAGVYGLLRVGVPTFPVGADNLTPVLLTLAVLGIIYGSLVAWRAETMRLVVGYSSLAHLGFIVLGIMAFDLQAGQGAVLQMVNHGLVVAATFGIVAMLARTGSEQMDRVSGLGAGAPWLGGVFLIVAMAALAIPGSNAFVGEFFILAGVFREHTWAAILACIGIVYAAVYMLRLYQDMMNGPRVGDGRKAEFRLPDVLAILPIVLLMGLIALWPQSIVGATRESVKRAIEPARAVAHDTITPLGEVVKP